MLKALAFRTAEFAATLAVASVVVFAVMRLVPGDPAQLMLGMSASPEAVAALRADLGLDRPLPVQYLAWIGGLLTGDLGTSYTYDVPVATLLAERAAVSLPLAGLALALSTLVAVPLGAVAAARHRSLADVAVMGASQVGLAIPNFWFGMILVSLFAVGLGLFPSGGFPGWDAGLGAALGALALPAVALALPQAAILARIMRTALVEILEEDYMRLARAKGLPFAAAVRRHGLRNALIPVLTILGLQFSFLIAGTIIIENVFYLPGLGRLVFQAIQSRDLIVVESVVLVLAAAIVAVNYLVDVASVAADPRLRARRA